MRTCHYCKTSSEKTVECQMEHTWCSVCLEDILNLYYEEMETDTTFYWPDGCPVCTHSCPCTFCKKRRGVDNSVSLKRKKIYQIPVRSLLNDKKFQYKRVKIAEQNYQDTLLHSEEKENESLMNQLIDKQNNSQYNSIHIDDNQSLDKLQDNTHIKIDQLKEDQNNEIDDHNNNLTKSNTKECKMKKVKRIPFSDFTLKDFEEIVVKKRKPVILTQSTSSYSPSLWTPDYLLKHFPKIPIDVRYMSFEENDMYGPFVVLKDSKRSIEWYVKNAEVPDYHSDLDQFRADGNNCKIVIYAKDFCFGDHVKEWVDDLTSRLPEYLELCGKNDMLGYLPENCRAVVLMAYIGCEGTRTPLHIDKLNTVAFNSHIYGTGIKKWWIVDYKDTDLLSDILNRRKAVLSSEDYWMDPNELKSIPGLRLYEFEQHKGDTVLVPPGAPHEVLNIGKGISFAVAANIINKFGVGYCWSLDKYNRLHSVKSIYRLKAIVYYGIIKELKVLDNQNSNTPNDINHSCDSLVQLLPIFKEIIEEEEVDVSNYKRGEILNDTDSIPHRRVCDLCQADIFNRRFHCYECGDDLEDGQDICVQCVKVPSFIHQHKLYLVQKFSIETLLNLFHTAQSTLAKFSFLQ